MRAEFDINGDPANILSQGELTPLGSAYADAARSLGRFPSPVAAVEYQVGREHGLIDGETSQLVHTVMKDLVMISVGQDEDASFTDVQHEDQLYDDALAVIVGVEGD